MKKTIVLKKCFTAALALCLLLGGLTTAYAMGDRPFPEVPASGSCGPCASYRLEDGVMTISGAGPVTRLPDFGFYNYPVTKVVIEEGITAMIGDALFAFFSNITEVELPDSLCYLGRMAFYNTPWMDSLTDEFYIVGDGILLDYNGPGGRVVVPDTVRSIACDAFFDAAVTELVLGESVKYIGDGTWGIEGCAEMEKITINGETTEWRYTDLWEKGYSPWRKAEAQNSGYASFLVMDGVLLAYSGSDSVITVPDGVHTIAPGGLHGSFVELNIPETVTEIGENAVSGGSVEDGTPVIVRGAPDSAVQAYVEHTTDWLFRFLPVGQDNSSLLNFIVREEFYPKKFIDVPEEEWFHPSVGAAFEMGLMNGKSDGSFAAFDPYGGIKLCEAVAVAARVRDIYRDGQADFTASGLWYQPYVDYALANGMIKEAPDNWERPATRAEFASLLATALPEKELEAINEDAAFADMDETHPAYDAVMLLAKAGVMQGKGEGRFDPDALVKRSEAAAMLTRCVRPGERVKAE